jgi:hypothetical protein
MKSAIGSGKGLGDTRESNQDEEKGGGQKYKYLLPTLPPRHAAAALGFLFSAVAVAVDIAASFCCLLGRGCRLEGTPDVQGWMDDCFSHGFMGLLSYLGLL